MLNGAITLVYSIYESAQALGVPFSDIEFRNWLLFQQAEKEYPCRRLARTARSEEHDER